MRYVLCEVTNVHNVAVYSVLAWIFQEAHNSHDLSTYLGKTEWRSRTNHYCRLMITENKSRVRIRVSTVGGVGWGWLAIGLGLRLRLGSGL